MSSDLEFDYFCCRCYQSVQKVGPGGRVLSCSDFLCVSCSKDIQYPITCPACRKSNVNSILINDSDLPQEVKTSLIDPKIKLMELQTTMQFQIKHYKTVIARVLSRSMRERKESFRRINELENQLKMNIANGVKPISNDISSK